MDLKLELERSIGEGPALPAPGEHLRRGRRALRRRRLTVGVGALALVVGGAGYAVLADAGSDQAPGVANDSGAPVDEFLDEVPPGLVNGCEGDPRADCKPMPVDFTATGELRRLQGTRIISLVIDPALRGDVEKSAGLEVVFEEERLWLSLQWARDGASSGREPAGAEGATFEEWLALPGTFGGFVAEQPVPHHLDWWNSRTGDFEVPDGVRVVRRVDDPIEDAAFEDSAGVVFDFQGRRYWTLTTRAAVRAEGKPAGYVQMRGVTVVEAATEKPGTDFDAWLRDQASERTELQAP